MSETSTYFQPVCGKNSIQAKTTAKGGGKTWREMHSSLGKGEQRLLVEALLPLEMSVCMALLLTRAKVFEKVDPVSAFVSLPKSISINGAALACFSIFSTGISEILLTLPGLYSFSILFYVLVLSSFRDLLNVVNPIGMG